MIQSAISLANEIGSKYGGLLGVIGIILGALGLLYGLYSRNNPKKPKHQIYYKIFGLESSVPFRALANRLSKNKDPFCSYIDIWNSGSEPIENSVVRKPLTINSQSGAEIEFISIDKESHPGLSKFQIESTNDGNNITWSHFDPGMCARIEIKSKRPINQDDLILFGSGYRMDIKRLPTSMEIRTPLEIFIAALLIIGTMTIISVALGSAVLSQSFHVINRTIVYIFIIPAIFAVTIIISLSIASPIFAMLAIKEILTAKSPIEKELGSPDIEQIQTGMFSPEEMRYERRRLLEVSYSSPPSKRPTSRGKSAEKKEDL
jgi:hypothetical protein